MTQPSREDMIVLSMGVNTLLVCVRQTEAWCRSQGDHASLRLMRCLTHAILAARRNLIAHTDPQEVGDDITEALAMAEGVRDAAQQCREGQAALYDRLIGAAETIERLCGAPIRRS